MELLATVISIVVGIATIGSLLFAASKWIMMRDVYNKEHKKEYEALKIESETQDEKINLRLYNLEKENAVIVYSLLACLDGLKQLGANGNVTKAHEDLEKHINLQAHDIPEDYHIIL